MKKNILFITNLLPYPLDNGGKIKTYNTLKILSKTYLIDLVCFIEHESEIQYIQEIEKLNIRVEFVKHSLIHGNKPVKLFAELIKSLFSPYPYIINKFRSHQMTRLIKKKIKAANYDYFYFDHLQLYVYKQLIPLKGIKILDQHNAENAIVKRRLEHSSNPLAKMFLSTEYKKSVRFERKALLDADLVLAITELDKIQFHQLAGKDIKVKIAPFFVELNKVPTEVEKPREKALLFLGTMSWFPNEDGILWFCENVFNKYNLKQAGWKLFIVGKDPGKQVQELNDNTNIFVTGFVDSIKPYIEKSLISIVPLRIGGGMRIKIFDLFNNNIPVISSSIGCEGIAVEDKKNILVANTPEEFLASINWLADDEQLRKEIADNARTFITENHSFEAAVLKFETLLSSV